MLKLERVISVVARRFRSRAVVELENLPLRHQRSPWQNAYVERATGSIRRECFDHSVIFNERDLRRVLSSSVDYYQRTRTHLSLDKDCLELRPIQSRRVGKVIAIPLVGGLHHRYERLAAGFATDSCSPFVARRPVRRRLRIYVSSVFQPRSGWAAPGSDRSPCGYRKPRPR